MCAADIDNHRTFRMISETRFLNALHAAGIYFHVAGEGWHATIPNTPISAAAGGSATLTTTLEDEDMPVIYLDPTTKKYRIAGPDLPDRPALDVRTGKPLDGNQVLAVNAFLLKQPPYYPNGKQGAAVFPSEDVRKVILGVLGWL